jgi:hypothetical protein
MSRFIVTTSINPPTEAIEAFDEMRGWELLVVGDTRTPHAYRLAAAPISRPGRSTTRRCPRPSVGTASSAVTSGS